MLPAARTGRDDQANHSATHHRLKPNACHPCETHDAQEPGAHYVAPSNIAQAQNLDQSHACHVGTGSAAARCRPDHPLEPAVRQPRSRHRVVGRCAHASPGMGALRCTSGVGHSLRLAPDRVERYSDRAALETPGRRTPPADYVDGANTPPGTRPGSSPRRWHRRRLAGLQPEPLAADRPGMGRRHRDIRARCRYWPHHGAQPLSGGDHQGRCESPQTDQHVARRARPHPGAGYPHAIEAASTGTALGIRRDQRASSRCLREKAVRAGQSTTGYRNVDLCEGTGCRSRHTSPQARLRCARRICLW